jgi:hypothetical protein
MHYRGIPDVTAGCFPACLAAGGNVAAFYTYIKESLYLIGWPNYYDSKHNLEGYGKEP